MRAVIERRIDITIERLSAIMEELTPEQLEQLARTKWWSVVVMLQGVRAMERGEESMGGRVCAPVADAYDRVVVPGEPLVGALLRAFGAAFGGAVEVENAGRQFVTAE